MSILDIPREMGKAEDEAARAIYESRNGAGCVPWSRRDSAHKQPYRNDAAAAIARLKQLGLIPTPSHQETDK